MNDEKIEEIFTILAKEYPNAKTALRYETPFQLLVAVILSARCTDKRVNQITKKLFKKYSKPSDFARLSPEELAQDLRGCGLHHNKSRYIIEASRLLVKKYNSQVPSSRKILQQLPGVGRKSANVVLNVAFNKDVIPVDTHVFRVSHRLGLASSAAPEKTEIELMNCIPAGLRRDAHHRLIKHGRKVCRAQKPDCQSCALAKLCPRIDVE